MDSVVLDRVEDFLNKSEAPLTSPYNRNTTDLGNAERFIDLSNGHIKYIAEMKQWLQWFDGRWITIPSVYDFAKSVVRSIYQESIECSSTDRRQSLAKWAASSESKGRIDAMIGIAQNSKEILLPVNQMDQQSDLIGCGNGVISLPLGVLIDPDHNKYVTKSISASLDPTAGCPNWEKFVDEIMGGNSELVLFLQRLAGYALHGGNPEQVMAILHGGGANGKSVFINTLKDIIGDYGKKIEPSTLTVSRHGSSGGGAREDLVRLFRCRLGVTTETADGDQLDESFVKAVSGGEEIACRAPHAKRSIEYKPEYLMMLATNHVPIIRGTDDGIWRRIILVPFEVSFKGREDRGLPQRLKSEHNGILNWLLDGYAAWNEHGLMPPESVLKATQSYKTDQDTLKEWMSDCCQVGRDFSCPSADLYNSYRLWATDNGIGALSKPRFTRQLKDRGIDKNQNGYKKPYIGIALR